MSETLNEFTERMDSGADPSINVNEPSPETPKFNPTVDAFGLGGAMDIDNEDEDDKGGEAPGDTTGNTEPPKGKVTLGKVISGKSAVSILNVFLPSFIVWSLSRFGYRSDKRQFKLTTEEREILSPVVQDCLDHVYVNFDNPFYTLAFVVGMIYGGKVLDAMPDIKKTVTKEDTYEEEQTYYRPSRPQAGKDEDAPPPVEDKYRAVREKIESTTIRREKNKLVIEEMEAGNPTDLIEAWKIYNGIFPERNENYFRKWYNSNYELMPESLRFPDGNNNPMD